LLTTLFAMSHFHFNFNFNFKTVPVQFAFACRYCSNLSIFPAYWAHSTKLAVVGLLLWAHAKTYSIRALYRLDG